MSASSDVTAPPAVARTARRFEVHGTVQGVGFRPFVYRLATSLGLDGSVRNAGGRVVVEAAGAADALAVFATRIATDAPGHAVVTRVDAAELGGAGPLPGSGFTVAPSLAVSGTARDLPPDLATCADCLRELWDPADRRYRYPFVNCTSCGPRATIIDDLPYDRTRTAMAAFPLCPACAAEYHDPADRRFHAEPVACPACGPRLSWRADQDPEPEPGWLGEEALARAVALVASGGIVALKGLGGYQLVCDATDGDAVDRLRKRKRRPAKPFAVMVADLAAARRLAALGDAEVHALTSAARPIVLARCDDGRPLATGVHPGVDRVGLFLPYTPLHHLLLHDLDRPLVVTSGNRSDEPIVVDDAEALDRLGGVADGFLQHDRPIRARYDDSVAQVAPGRHGAVVTLVRRARGYAPEPLPLPVPAPRPLVAAGAQLKHTFALARGWRALVGPHTGDLEDAETLDAFEATYGHLCRLQALDPELVAHDLHPGYLSTRFAGRWPAGRRVAVQHHHAHVASCAAEHGVTGPFLGVAYDGLGLGGDGTLWGGEVLQATLAGYRRLARFATAPLPGGAAAVRRPARMALGYLFGAERFAGEPRFDEDLVRLHTGRLEPAEVETVRRMVARRVNSPLASSAGRLFDAVASLVGLRDDATYEGEAAVVLESAAASWLGRDRVGPGDELPWRLVRHEGLWVYDPVPTLYAVLAARADGVPAAAVAAAFHRTVIAVTVALCERLAAETGVRTVCLSGGCFQNQQLLAALPAALADLGLRVLVNERVPANDGGISYGQAAVAAARLTRG